MGNFTSAPNFTHIITLDVFEKALKLAESLPQVCHLHIKPNSNLIQVHMLSGMSVNNISKILMNTKFFELKFFVRLFLTKIDLQRIT